MSLRAARVVWVKVVWIVAIGLGVVSCTSNTPVRNGAGPTSTTNLITVATTADAADLAACIATWPLRDRIALMVWPGAYSNDWASVEQAVRDLHVGGVVLFGPDDEFVANLAVHLSGLDALSPHGLLIATDEEGGDVQRLRALEPIPSQQDMSALTQAERTTILDRHAQLIAAAGLDVVLGPVVDVRPVVGTDPLGDGRLFIGDPQQVAALGAEYVAAWQGAGMLAVLKHFPGHGSASADTHERLATTPPLDAMRDYDLVPFQQLASSGAAVMVGHLNVPGLTDGQAASMSPAAIALVRQMGYSDALVLSDALGMDAVGIDVADAAVLSVQAGIDVVIFTAISETTGVIDAIEAAVNDGRLTVADIDDSALRVTRLLEADGRPCLAAPN